MPSYCLPTLPHLGPACTQVLLLDLLLIVGKLGMMDRLQKHSRGLLGDIYAVD